jgi:hypothetical protein
MTTRMFRAGYACAPASGRGARDQATPGIAVMRHAILLR